jgi:haloacetate dehalogenase
MKKGQVIRNITTADYAADPSNCGSHAIADLFPDFQHQDIRTSGAVIRLRHGGSGPPLMLLHGNPQNHVSWHKVAGRLAEHYHVVLPDLRGYGDSSLPEPGDKHINYSFRTMATDMIEVMATFGYQQFYVAGHDRGGRTAHRMCIDHPGSILKVCLMDVLPNVLRCTGGESEGAVLALTAARPGKDDASVQL